MSKLSSYPNMYPEVLEAIHLMFEDYPNVEVDCLLYLSKLRDNWPRTAELSNEATKDLIKMNRCPYCGEKMQMAQHREVHMELEGFPTEIVCESYCPNCDTGSFDDWEGK